jgi:hypothetical protein
MGREAAVVTLSVDSPAEVSAEVQLKLQQTAKRLAMHVVRPSASLCLLPLHYGSTPL